MTLLLILLFLGTDQEEVEHHEDQNHGQEADDHFQHAALSRSGGVGGSSGGLSGGRGDAEQTIKSHRKNPLSII